MEEKINIAEILKDKPVGLKLYSNTFGYISFNVVHKDKIYFLSEDDYTHSVKSNGKMYDDGECVIFPSKEMRDWEKFAWKKGDVLVCKDNSHILFEKFNDDTYTTFTGKLYYQATRAGYSYTHTRNLAMTQDFDIEKDDDAQTYINTIEEKLGGKLNRETLEVEKAQPEFKDGDIVHDVHGYNTYIIKEFTNKHIKIYAGLSKQYGAISHKIGISSIFHLRLATEEEKQQLFDALAKEGKHWDAEKKQIVDLKPKYEFKPMDLCLMKYIGKYNNRGWELCQYAYTEHRVSSIGEQRDFYHAVGGEIYAECIPYKGNEHLLGTKKSK